MKTTPKTILALTCAVTTSAFVIHHPPQRITTTTTVNTRLLDTPIVSPFDDTTTATTEIKYVRNTIAPPQDDSQGFAITAEMRDTQHKLNIHRKYQMLKQKHKEHEREGTTLYQQIEG